MSFLDKVKQVTGIGTLRVELQVPERLDPLSRVLDGSVTLTAASRQQVQAIRIKLRARVTSGRGEDETKRDYELGKLELTQRFELKEGEVKVVDFALPFQVRGFTANPASAAHKLFAWANNERVKLEARAVVDVAGAALDPSDRQPIQFA